MRKILLGTTAVVGAALLSAGVAQAQQAPTVRVGGYFEFTGGWIDDSYDKNAVNVPAVGTSPARTVSRDHIDFRSDLEIVVTVAGKAANGLSYGAEVELQIDNANGGNGGTVDTDEVWGYISSPTLGTLQFGDQDSAADQLKVALGSNFTGYGESGSWDEFIAPGADGNRYIIASINDGSDATKIIYLSPQFYGFDFGVSYAPNGREGENFLNPAGTALQRDPTDSIRNELSGAVRYRGSFGNIGVQLGFAAMRADAQTTNGVVYNGAVYGLQDVTQYQVGLNVTGYGLAAGVAYQWGKYGGATRTPLRAGLDSSSSWAIGASYTYQAFKVGAFYAYAERDNGPNLADRTSRVIGVGVVYTLAPGLELFGNYTNVNDENIATNTTNPTALGVPGNGPGGRDRDIDIIVIGTRLTF